MKEIYFRLATIACSILMLSTSPSQAATRTSSTDGNWGSTSTWGGDPVPGSGDDVVIASSTTVTIDAGASVSCRNLTIYGTLQFADPSNSAQMVVNGDVTVAPSGTLQAAATANNYAVNWIYIYGSLDINGTFTAKVTGVSTTKLAISMEGSPTGISGSGIDFSGYLEIDVGTSGLLVLNSPVSISGELYLYHGTLDNTSNNFTLGGEIDRFHSDAVVTSPPAFSGASQTIVYWAAMTTGPELPDNFSTLRVDISGGGSVALSKSVTVSGLRFADAGDKLITGANTITISGYISTNDVTNYVIGNLAWQFSSTGIHDFPVGSATAYRPVNVHVTSLTGSGTITVSETDAAPASSSLPTGVNEISSVRYWTLSKSAGITAAIADVTLNWGSDDGVSNPGEITVVHGDHSTGNWDAASGTGSGTASSGTVTGTGFTSFSDFTLGTTGSDNSLAVDATSFAAKSDVESVTLTWKTQSEVDNAGFNILRQDPGETSFRLIASYTSNDNLKGMGTSSSGRNYRFTDTKVKSGSSYQYKIQSVSTDGTTKDLATLTVTVSVPKGYALYQNFPNPFNPSTMIRFDLKQASTVTLEIYNVLGQRVEGWYYGVMDAGRYDEIVSMDKFASGVYFYKLVASGVEPTAVGNSAQGGSASGGDGQKFTATKKLLLVK